MQGSWTAYVSIDFRRGRLDGKSVRKMMGIIKERERESAARGEKFVSFAKPRRVE